MILSQFNISNFQLFEFQSKTSQSTMDHTPSRSKSPSERLTDPHWLLRNRRDIKVSCGRYKMDFGAAAFVVCFFIGSFFFVWILLSISHLLFFSFFEEKVILIQIKSGFTLCRINGNKKWLQRNLQECLLETIYF